MSTAAHQKTPMSDPAFAELSPDCLSEVELVQVSEGASLPATRAAHLNRCPECQVLVSKMNAFNPEAIAEAVIVARDPLGVARRRRSRLRSLVSVVVAGAVVAALFALFAAHEVTVRDDAAFERTRADAATGELALARSELISSKAALASVPTYVKGLGSESASLWGSYAVYSNASSWTPQKGDILLTSGTMYGHTAVVTGVQGTTVYVNDLNWSTASTTCASSSATLGLNKTTGAYAWQSGPYSSAVLGWLRPPAAASGE